MYTYPEALNAFEKIATDLFARALPGKRIEVRVVADSVTGTASVDWSLPSSPDAYGASRYGTYQYVTINLPVKPATYRMTPEEFEDWCAYNLHEVGHPLHTDKAVWQACCAAGEHRLVNALEDVREEKLTIDMGLALNAKAVFSRLIDKLQARNLAKGYDANDYRSIGWTMSFLGRHANGYAIDGEALRASIDPNGVVGRIVPWALKELADAKSTQDCWDLAKKIIKAVNDAKKAEPKQPEPEVPEIDGDEGLAPPEKRGGQNEHRGEQPEPAQGPDVPEEPKDSEQPDDDQLRGGEGGKGEGDEGGKSDASKDDADAQADEPFTDSDVEAVDLKPNDRDELTSTSLKQFAARDVTSMLRRVLKNRTTDYDIRGRDVDGSVDLVARDASKMGQQRQLLARALKRNEEDEYDTGRLSGRLDGRALARVAVRDGRVFGKRTTSEGYDTDVQVLVDGSGSMSGRSIRAASTLALVVAQAASQVGVDCTTHLFNDRGLHAATRGRAKPVGRKFAYMASNIMGGTPLTENLLRAVKLQKARAGNKRKVLFLITDGGCNSGPSVLKAAGEYVEQAEGVELVNLHIGPVPMKLFRNEAAVNVKAVAKTGLRQLTQLLERGL